MTDIVTVPEQRTTFAICVYHEKLINSEVEL